MISKKKLTEIVQKSVEDAWYNRRSLNPVKEQTEIITNAIWEQLNKPAVNKTVCALATISVEVNTDLNFNPPLVTVKVKQTDC